MSDLIIYGDDSTTAKNMSIAQQLTLVKVDVSRLRDLGKGVGTGALINSLEKLVELIFSLRSLVNDSSSDALLQTNAEINSDSLSVASEPPLAAEERLIPYVAEELVDIWHHFLEGQKTTEKSYPKSGNLSDKSPSEIVTLGDLQTLLLWRLGCSAENIMALLTGIEVMVTSPRGTRKPGVLRLVASLILKTPQGQYDLDLATGESPKFNLHHNAIVQSFDCELCTVPRSAKSLLEQLKNIINQEFEALDLWKSQSIAVLEPGYNWEPGQLLLDFGFQFLVNYPSMLWSNHQVNEVNYDPMEGSYDSEEMTPYLLLVSQLKLTDMMIFSRSFQERIIQKIAVPLEKFCLSYENFAAADEPAQSSVSHSKNRRVSSPEPKLSPDIFNRFLIRKAWDLVEAIASESQDNRQSSPYGYVMIPQVSLSQLIQSLMWHTVRGSAAIARLIGGITVRVLEPGKLWYKGTLRLVAILSADFPGYHWEIDIATREPPRLIGTILDESAVIDWQPDQTGVDNGGLASAIDTPSPVQCLGGQRFQQVGICSDAIITQLRDVSPELGIWIDGVEIDWEEPMITESILRSGLAQLVLVWEWVK
ncbi:MAG: hypothetical protein P5702_19840 [Limnospira sp. PMC 1291.21]|uniref:hypothetical protein n=1 Tax=Limnospira TaxID=2596745 RepID=UPI0002803F75|nr:MULTISPECIES: hypothetical protein [Limnospira]EKD10799.1 hypothetical protein SPLC1_S050070 [Arthrospira platensis C1]MDT9179896.1 hypothetical protein [Limnospira sp. PMC 1238.20]MDT9195141.1 hypothetical protein [Limnospira sp. PMC 1245.20]MDT9200399.1 hypothetical protein [Limnospira sp. PMC 1042.18]MDT9205358.1 hypothetical protein [Limnospira sp. PMC 1243.20]